MSTQNKTDKFIFKASSCGKETMTNIGPYLALKFSSRKFSIGYYHPAKKSHRYPPKGILISRIKQAFNQSQIDNIIQSYLNTITIGYIQQEFDKCDDIKDNIILIDKLKIFLREYRMMVQ